MNFVKKLRNKNLQVNKYIFLRKTKKITPDDLIHPRWSSLQKEYDSANKGELEGIEKVLLTMVNSAFNQEKTIFCLSRNALIKMTLEDKNFKEKSSISNSQWKSFIKTIIECGIVRVKESVKSPYGQSIHIFEIIEPELLELFPKVNKERDLSEALAYLNAIRDVRDEDVEEDSRTEASLNTGDSGANEGPFKEDLPKLEAATLDNPEKVESLTFNFLDKIYNSKNIFGRERGMCSDLIDSMVDGKLTQKDSEFMVPDILEKLRLNFHGQTGASLFVKFEMYLKKGLEAYLAKINEKPKKIGDIMCITDDRIWDIYGVTQFQPDPESDEIFVCERLRDSKGEITNDVKLVAKGSKLAIKKDWESKNSYYGKFGEKHPEVLEHIRKIME